MKKLTINKIAGAGLRASRRSYLGMAAGIFLSILLISGMCLCVQGMLLAQQAKVHARIGYEETILFDNGTTNEELRALGWFDEIGTVSITGIIADTDVHLGYYDKVSERLLNRQFIEGRMPEKSGEIAVEETNLPFIDENATVGDRVVLDITPLDGVTEKREYTLVGILKDQSYMTNAGGVYSGGIILYFPSVICHPDETEFSTGRIAQHRVMTLAPGQRLHNVLRKSYKTSLDFSGGAFLGVDSRGQLVPGVAELDELSGSAGSTIIILSMLIGALLLAACTGIAGSMEAQLTRKSEEIGMLRAVGATRRQIRRIFGREAWILALIISPASLAFACAGVWGLSSIWPEEIIFAPNPWLLLPILVLSMLAILLSSSLPLRRASKIMPMSIIRNTATLRKAKKIKSSKRFNVASLVSRRQIRLNPSRLLAPAMLVGLSMLILVFIGTFAAEMTEAYMIGTADFELYDYNDDNWRFSSVIPVRQLSGSDIARIEAMPYVDRTESMYMGTVNLLLDEVTDYLLPDDWYTPTDTWHLMSNPPEFAESFVAEHNAVRHVLQTDKSLLSMELVIADPAVTGWKKWLDAQKADGVDIGALDRGEAVLIYAPSYYTTTHEGGAITNTKFDPEKEYASIRINDCFFEDQMLNFVQLRVQDDLYDNSFWANTYDEYLIMYESCERTDVSARIEKVYDQNLDIDGTQYAFWEPSVITTARGAQAMGLAADHLFHMDVYLSELPEAEEEADMETRLGQIALKGDMESRNNLRINRENKQGVRQLILVLSAIVIVFYAMSVSLVAGNISRRIRADARKIGTLRAVGADKRVLAGCYSGQVFLTVGIGAILGIILFTVMYLTEVLPVNRYSAQVLLTMLVMGVGFLAATLAACLGILKRRINDVANRSIIDNIREL